MQFVCCVGVSNSLSVPQRLFVTACMYINVLHMFHCVNLCPHVQQIIMIDAKYEIRYSSTRMYHMTMGSSSVLLVGLLSILEFSKYTVYPASKLSLLALG